MLTRCPDFSAARGRYTEWFMTRFTISLLAVLSLAPAYAQKPFEFWPGTTYDPKIPTVRQVLGYEPGDKVTSHAGLVKYMEALSAAVPSRIKVFEYGESWEGRKLIYAAVGRCAARLPPLRMKSIRTSWRYITGQRLPSISTCTSGICRRNFFAVLRHTPICLATAARVNSFIKDTFLHIESGGFCVYVTSARSLFMARLTVARLTPISLATSSWVTSADFPVSSASANIDR